MKTPKKTVRRTFRDALVALAAAAVVLAGTGTDGQKGFSQDGAPKDPARMEAERERLRREFDAAQARIVDAYIAEQPPGAARADVNLLIGTLYEMGKLGAGDPDRVRAAKYYEAAAAMGSGNALCALGSLYASGAESPDGRIAADAEKSRDYFRRAADAGSVRALVELGMIYADGKNVDPDSKRALEYFMQAAKHGDPDALDRLEPVMRKAREWEAAKPGREGKAGFPTSKEAIIDKELIDRYIDVNFNLQKQMSSIFVELGRRLMAASKKR